MGPEFVGKTKDSNTKDTPNLSSKAVEEPVDGTQTVLRTISVEATNNGYEKEAIENPTATIPFSEPETKRSRDKMAEKQKTSFQTTRVSTQ